MNVFKKAVGYSALALTLSGMASTSLLAVEKLTFTASLMGEDFQGGFSKFNKNFTFDAAKPQAALLELQVNTASFFSGDAERDELAVGSEWFAASSFATAIVKGSLAATTVQQQYQFNGTIELKGLIKPISFPLQISKTSTGYHYQGEARLNRLDFNVGTGEWTDTSTIGNQIKIQFQFDS
ncbi:YceI family protein [Pelagibaculum spongiae]|uniref:Lipid/polyisoprenoid-binding YceI-like domain-containing protein n=1 Tax=Pelagibaculum spongiae TaxID=2080658 RepID=A0A2V1H1X0_9GAMM|nr:YceI family protein [Pelagibaculum spongiae]PVZ71960.1 hypothetical protein DC094_02760 [Pelagibaculum spongiae]